ncbi:MAG TPA: sensor histidine kinase [Burkholderiaceae bacterium]|nr:sensor histidine kinase [Burkholderiaceae bacterium]
MMRFPGGRSLRRQLLLWLLLPQLVLWLAAAFVTYNVALRYANRGIDASLSQATRSLARQVKPIGNGLFVDLPRAAQDIIEADPKDRVYYMVSTPPGQFILGNRRLPAPPAINEPRLGDPYFYDGVMEPPAGPSGTPPQRVRVAAMFLAFGEDQPPQTMLVQVARSSANREELARSILVDTVLPLSGLILLMSLIVWAGIRAGLAPLNRLRALVEDRAPNDLAPLEIEAAPQEVRALARALNTLLAAVNSHVAAHQRFISDAAHQLRTPLAGLKSQTELALQAASDPALHARLERVHQSATRSAHLVNQLLTLARAEPGAARASSHAPVDLHRLARELTAELVPRALQAGVDLGFEDAGDDAPAAVEVQGNALLLREALVNLIDNAVRYAGRGSEVTVRARQTGRDACIVVEDNGPGIPSADRERVFERFVRATHEGSGCGLGLAIVKEIAEQHGGEVTLADAHPGQQPPGLRAALRLPARVNTV